MNRSRIRTVKKWMQPGIQIKRWLLLLAIGLLILGAGFVQGFVILFDDQTLPPLLNYLTLGFLSSAFRALVAGTAGICLVAIALYELNNSILQPIVAQSQMPWVDIVTQHNRLQRGLHVVVIGGGTGLPSVLRGMKTVTTNITAVVTVADDGGSSGRLRREMGILPPGDLRNNIAALSDDEDMMTRLFLYRFGEGDLSGHSFGNLFLTALSEITGNMEAAVAVAGRVLAISGRVMPSTLYDVNLGAEVRLPDGKLKRITGESNITSAEGRVERVFLEPSNAQALPEVIQSILSASLIIIGPGSLYTSILPNLLVRGIVDALRVSAARVVYVCNITQQPGETDDYTVAEHVEALEKHIGEAVIDVVLANDAYPKHRDVASEYVRPAASGHPIYERYRVVMGDLTDNERPWRHDSEKLVTRLLQVHDDFEDNDKQAKNLSRTA
jgi:uncharacterized cofD-like protein